MDDLEAAYRRWYDGEFRDDEVSEYTGLTPRSLRELAKWGAIEKSSRESNRPRTWKRPAICMAAMAAALQMAGLSLTMAARLAFHVWHLHPNNSDDPFLRFPAWEELTAPRLWIEARKAGEHAVSAWLRDDFFAPILDPEFDSLVHIVDGCYVVVEAGVTPWYREAVASLDDGVREQLREYLDLRLTRPGPELVQQFARRLADDDQELVLLALDLAAKRDTGYAEALFDEYCARSRRKFEKSVKEMKTAYLGRLAVDRSNLFVWQRPMRRKTTADELARYQDFWQRMDVRRCEPDGYEDYLGEFKRFLQSLPWPPADQYMVEQYGDVVDLKALACRFEEPDLVGAELAYARPIAKTTVNVTLAMRITMRRAMDLPVLTAARKPQPEHSDDTP